MGATPVVSRSVEDASRPGRRDGVPEPVARREPAAWGYLVHPSLMPTVFAPSQGDPDRDIPKVVVRKV
jgi:hypothetical protein